MTDAVGTPAQPAGTFREPAGTAPAMSQRGLNRATLARQLLLERAAMPAVDAVAHLAGMQSQAPLAPYVGLWTRLADFDPAELADLTTGRAVLRAHLMRTTVHLVTAADYLAWHGLFAPLHARSFASQPFASQLAGAVVPELLAVARPLLAERPRTRRELGELLAARWPEADRTSLAYAVHHHLPALQTPPRGVWGSTGPATWTTVESWLGRPVDADPAPDQLVLRYLAAYGPATVADVQAWSGLTRLREVVDRLPLRRFAGGLYDLPDAPRPDPDTPAPPRFLPEYDNLLLSYADRTRVNPDRRRVPLPPGNGAAGGTLLVDGLWHGEWSLRRAKDEARLRVSLYHPVADEEALAEEGGTLLEFLAPEAGTREVEISGR
ncbi:MAG: winged helix DNA-binding domain-containing protein [Micromonosporaceae bacterium]